MKAIAKTSVFTACVISMGFLVTSCAPTTFEDKVDWGKSAVSSYMDLTDEQEPALEEIADTLKTNYPDFKNYRVEFQTILREELQKEQFNSGRVNQKVGELKAKVLSSGTEIISEFAQLHAVLDEEQRQTIQEHSMKQRNHRRWGRHHDWDDEDRPRWSHQDFDLQPNQAVVLKKLVSSIAGDSVDVMMAKAKLKKVVHAQLASDNFNAQAVKSEFEATVKVVFDSAEKHVPQYAALHALFDARQRGILVSKIDFWIQRSQEKD